MHPVRNSGNQNSNYAISIYKLARQKYKWRNRVSQFINLNSVIRILVKPVTHPVRNWGKFFPTLFSIRI